MYRHPLSLWSKWKLKLSIIAREKRQSKHSAVEVLETATSVGAHRAKGRILHSNFWMALLEPPSTFGL
jgi:hypothetical protein